MATKPVTLVHVDEEYIDLELLSSSSNLLSYSPTQNREFEFQMSCGSNEKESTTSPADDLFYKGKLLPLHLPPRLQMVQKLLENPNANFDSAFTSDLRVPSTNDSKISPSESCRVSTDANPDEYLIGWSSDMNGNKFWPKKLKQMKQFWLGQRLKASRAYLKALFTKSGCSDKSCASAASSNNVGAEKKTKCKECQNKYEKVARKNHLPFEIFYDNKHQISCAVMKREMLEDDFINHRRSFSGVVQRHCATKASSSLSTSSSGSSSSSSSSSFSFSSAGHYDLQLLKRSISANSELESSIEGAIAHCKQSQQQCSSKNAPDDSKICSQFARKVAVRGNQEMATLASTRG